ncbi:MAG: hypothetical protein RLZZ413_3077, partial [Pseudomonadota bacterium]
EPLQRRDGVRLGEVVMAIARQGGQDLCSRLGRPQNTADFVDDRTLDRVRSQAAGTVLLPGFAVLDHVHQDLITALPRALAKSGKRPFALK